MATLNPIKNTIHVDMRRDECPVIARSGSDAPAIRKQFAKLRKVLAGIPLSTDPAIDLKKTCDRRGLA